MAEELVKAGRLPEAVSACWNALLLGDTKDRSEQLSVLKSLIKCQQRGAGLLLEEESEIKNNKAAAAATDTGKLISALTPPQLQSYYRYLHDLRKATGRLQYQPPPSDAETRRLVTFDPRLGGGFVTRKLPRFFSWVVPGYLAGLSTPRNRDEIRALEALGVRLLVTLMEESPLPRDWFVGTSVRNVYYPVRNLSAPTVEEVDAFFKEVDDLTSQTPGLDRPPAVAVHCGGGVGRAGTMLACYLVRHGATVAKQFCAACKASASRLNRAVRSAECSGGDCPNAEPPRLSPQEAIQLLRLGRPGSLESDRQEEFVKKYSGKIWSRYASPGTDDDGVQDGGAGASNDLPLSMAGKTVKCPSFVVLVGLPGSGKSWVADALVKAGGWVRVSQDVEGSREACAKMVSSYCKRGKSVKVLLDRCNPTAAERKEWLELAFKPKDAVAVYFSADEELCRQRINSRFGHETVRAGGGKFALADMAKRMEPPTLGEGFCAVFCVHSFENARSLVEKWSLGGSSKPPEEQQAVKGASQSKPPKERDKPEPANQTKESQHPGQEPDQQMPGAGIHGVIKFPRTPHLFNTGGSSMSADDIVADTGRALSMIKDPSLKVQVQEKIDGANMGFSLDSGYRIVPQNRTHYISSKEQVQYGLLECWIPEHRERLMFLLGNEPGTRILFGEWMVAKHAIQYSWLPDYFLAYDVYDVDAGKFFSFARFREAVEQANSLEVEEPAIYSICSIEGVEWAGLGSNQKWKDVLMGRRSAYREGPVEGLYIRIDEGEWLKDRIKLVRPDFIAGSENWSKHRMTKNIVNLELFEQKR